MPISETKVTIPFLPDCIPLPGVWISILVMISIALRIIDQKKTLNITPLAPHLSDIHPPKALITPEGKLKSDANSPATTREAPYTFTKYGTSHCAKATKHPKTKK